MISNPKIQWLKRVSIYYCSGTDMFSKCFSGSWTVSVDEHMCVFSWSVIFGWLVTTASLTFLEGGRLVELDDRGDWISPFSASSRLAWFFVCVTVVNLQKRNQKPRTCLEVWLDSSIAICWLEARHKVGLESKEFEVMPPLDGRNCGVTLEKA